MKPTAAHSHDPALFLTTLACRDQSAFFGDVARGPGALAALRVVTRDAGARGDAIREAVGRDVVRRWPALVGALEVRWAPVDARSDAKPNGR